MNWRTHGKLIAGAVATIVSIPITLAVVMILAIAANVLTDTGNAGLIGFFAYPVIWWQVYKGFYVWN